MFYFVKKTILMNWLLRQLNTIIINCLDSIIQREWFLFLTKAGLHSNNYNIMKQ